jgi:hypothetical protein
MFLCPNAQGNAEDLYLAWVYKAARNSSKITVYDDNRSDRMDKNKILNCHQSITI